MKFCACSCCDASSCSMGWRRRACQMPLPAECEWCSPSWVPHVGNLWWGTAGGWAAQASRKLPVVYSVGWSVQAHLQSHEDGSLPAIHAGLLGLPGEGWGTVSRRPDWLHGVDISKDPGPGVVLDTAPGHWPRGIGVDTPVAHHLTHHQNAAAGHPCALMPTLLPSIHT